MFPIYKIHFIRKTALMPFFERNGSLIIQKLQTHYFYCFEYYNYFNIYIMLFSKRSWLLLMISKMLRESPLCARYLFKHHRYRERQAKLPFLT